MDYAQLEALYNMALNDPNRVINGDQYNALYEKFRPNMPDDEATRSFLAANYVMQGDFDAWYAAKGYYTPKENGGVENVDSLAVGISETEQRDNLYNMALNDPNRIINGDQYNALYAKFLPNMPDDAATRNFLAANYVMQGDFDAWYAAKGYDTPEANGDVENVAALAGRVSETEQRNNLYNMALNDPNRIINGEQYNALYENFRPNMPDDAATRSFLAANYVMKDDFDAWSAAMGYAMPKINGDIATVDAVAGRVPEIRVNADLIRRADGQYIATAVLPDYNLRYKIDSARFFLDNFQFGDYPPMSDADKEAGYYYSPLIDGFTYVRVRRGENGPEIHADDLMRRQDALHRFNKDTAVSALLPGVVSALPALKNISWLKNKTSYVKSSNVGSFTDVKNLNDFRARIPQNATELPWKEVPGGAKEGVKFRWTDEQGNVWNVRAHGPDLSAPAGSNAANGWIYRVEVRYGGQGKTYYMDSKGSFHPENVMRPNSPMYSEEIANDTHIPLKN